MRRRRRKTRAAPPLAEHAFGGRVPAGHERPPAHRCRAGSTAFRTVCVHRASLQALPWGRVHPGSRAQRWRGKEVQAVREARRADRRVRARARTRHRRGAARADRRTARAGRERRGSRRAPARVLCDRARDRQAQDGDAPLRRAADRRDGAARGLHRGDEDRRGQDAHGHARRGAQRAAPARACTWSPSTTTSPAATRNG